MYVAIDVIRLITAINRLKGTWGDRAGRLRRWRSWRCRAFSCWMSRVRSMYLRRRMCRPAGALSACASLAASPVRSAARRARGLCRRPVIGEATDERIDTLLVAGCPNARRERLAPAVNIVIGCGETAPVTRRYGSVCSGAFSAREAGLLDGRRVTTHWAVADRLAERFSVGDRRCRRDPRSGWPVRTAAGVTAGLDLALALVEEDLGRDVAMQVAGQLVMFFKRPGGQMQFSREGERGPAGRSALQEVQRWVAANPGLDHSVSRLRNAHGREPAAFRPAVSRRGRADPGGLGRSGARGRRARLLEEGRDTPKQVAARCGFADADTLRRAFAREVGVTPADYRKRHARLGSGSV